jgi:hypothetical protein
VEGLVGRTIAGTIQVPDWPGRGLPAQARITLSKAWSKRISQRVGAEPCERLAQRAVQPEFGGEQHHARIRAPPQDGLAFAEPGEDAPR